MFEISIREFENLKSHFATSSWGGRRNLPRAFIEQGVAMLSSILNSDTAIEVNIRIIRVFTKCVKKTPERSEGWQSCPTNRVQRGLPVLARPHFKQNP